MTSLFISENRLWRGIGNIIFLVPTTDNTNQLIWWALRVARDCIVHSKKVGWYIKWTYPDSSTFLVRGRKKRRRRSMLRGSTCHLLALSSQHCLISGAMENPTVFFSQILNSSFPQFYSVFSDSWNFYQSSNLCLYISMVVCNMCIKHLQEAYYHDILWGKGLEKMEWMVGPYFLFCQFCRLDLQKHNSLNFLTLCMSCFCF